MSPQIFFCCDDPERLIYANQLAADLGLPLSENNDLPAQGYILRVTRDRLLLEFRQRKTKHLLSAEFVTGALGYRQAKGGGLRQALARAVGLKNRHQGLNVLDGTAGLGKDGFILATLGCHVTFIERSKLLYFLLQDGLKRAEHAPKLSAVVKNQIKLVESDFRAYLKTLALQNYPQVIYLDPMFPEKSKNALTKMEMRIIRDIVGNDDDMEDMLTDALKLATNRVVVKRPAQAPYLEGIKPDYSMPGKRNRYDVYLTGVK